MLGMPEQNSGMFTGGLDSGSPEMKKELFLTSEPRW